MSSVFKAMKRGNNRRGHFMSLKWSFSVAAAAALVGAVTAPADAAAPRPAARRPADPVVSLRLEPKALSFADKRDARRVVVLGVTRAGSLLDLTPVATLTPV